MNITRICLSRPITVFMFFLLLLITGAVSLLRLPITFLPELDYPRITIITRYANSSPEEVEYLVTELIEEAASVVPGVRDIDSISREGLSLVTVKFNWDTEMSYAVIDLRERLDNVRQFLPEQALRPNIIRFDPDEEPVIYISLNGIEERAAGEVQYIAEEVIRRRLVQIPGVARVDIVGEPEELVEIILDRDKIETLGINIGELSQKIQDNNFRVPGGVISEGNYRFNLDIAGELSDIDDIRYIPIILNEDGREITLGDIARVQLGSAEKKSISRINGVAATGLFVHKESDANTVRVCRSVREEIARLREEYPQIEFIITVDQSCFISSSIAGVLEAIALGGLLAFIILYLFLRDLTTPFYIALVIPIAIMSCFILMFFSRLSLNIISLSGLALGVGMLVDNSIVVSESIIRQYDKTGCWRTAAYTGTKEVGRAITASTLTTLTVFVPILYVKGITSCLFYQQALTVSYSLLSSLIVSITLLPLLFALRARSFSTKRRNRDKFEKKNREITLNPDFHHNSKMIANTALLDPENSTHGFCKIVSGMQKSFLDILENFSLFHQKLLKLAMQNRIRILVLLMMFFIISLVILVNLDREFFPEFTQNNINLRIWLEPGATFKQMDSILKQIEEKLGKDDRISSFYCCAVNSSEDLYFHDYARDSKENMAQIKVIMKSSKHSEHISEDYTELLSMYPVQFYFSKGDNLLSSLVAFEGGGLSVKISGDDLDLMHRTAENIRERLAEEGDFFNIRKDFETDKPQIKLCLIRDALDFYNITTADIASTIQTGIYGEKVGKLKQFADEVDILMHYDDNADFDRLLNQNIHLKSSCVPLRKLVKAEYGKISAEIRRNGQKRIITLDMDYRGKLRDVVAKLEETIRGVNGSGNNIHASVVGRNREIAVSLRKLIAALGFSLLLVYMIMAAQFESLKLPFIIMFVAPMGIIGVCLALVVTRTSVNILSTIGMIILSGIIVNDAILLVDKANHLYKKGVDATNAALEAARIRLRPILMTTLTTILGLIPLAIGISSGSELQSAMAVAVIGGIFTATFLTLIIIPVLFSLIEK